MLDISAHFARTMQLWGTSVPSRHPIRLQGSLCICFGELAGSAWDTRIFTSDFQRKAAQLHEETYLRPPSFSFDSYATYSHSSYRIFGEFRGNSRVVGFAGLEVHANGAVSVYFRDYVSTEPVDDLFGWWMYGAWRIAMLTAALAFSPRLEFPHQAAASSFYEVGEKPEDPLSAELRDPRFWSPPFTTGIFDIDAPEDQRAPAGWADRNALHWVPEMRRRTVGESAIAESQGVSGPESGRWLQAAEQKYLHRLFGRA